MEEKSGHRFLTAPLPVFQQGSPRGREQQYPSAAPKGCSHSGQSLLPSCSGSHPSKALLHTTGHKGRSATHILLKGGLFLYSRQGDQQRASASLVPISIAAPSPSLSLRDLPG